MPGWGVQGGERSQPFVLSYSQLFFTCASFHNNKREFNFNALSGKKGKKKIIYSILNQRRGLASAVKYICTHLCMRQRQMTGATRMTSTQTHTAAWIFSCKMLKHILSKSQTKILLNAALHLWMKNQRERHQNKTTLFHYTAMWCSVGVHINMCTPRTRW